VASAPGNDQADTRATNTSQSKILIKEIPAQREFSLPGRELEFMTLIYQAKNKLKSPNRQICPGDIAFAF
jgi:hypothetical protein